jgi:hypothetical protein
MRIENGGSAAAAYRNQPGGFQAIEGAMDGGNRDAKLLGEGAHRGQLAAGRAGAAKDLAGQLAFYLSGNIMFFLWLCQRGMGLLHSPKLYNTVV